MSEGEATSCTKDYEKKFGHTDSSSKIRIKQRSKYENIGAYVYTRAHYMYLHSPNHLCHVFRNGNYGVQYDTTAWIWIFKNIR